MRFRLARRRTSPIFFLQPVCARRQSIGDILSPLDVRSHANDLQIGSSSQYSTPASRLDCAIDMQLALDLMAVPMIRLQK